MPFTDPADLNPLFSDDAVLEKLSAAYNKHEDCTLNDVFLKHDPFVHMQISSAFSEDLLHEAIHELSLVPYEKKNTDLYQFEQTESLASCDKIAITKIRSLFYDRIKPWLSSVFGMELNDRVHLTSSRYVETDHLLCHDDLVGEITEGRKIAFILYLVSPDWNEEDGGFLNLFKSDGNDEPIGISTSYIPKFNQIALFKVSSRSHHEVSEILSPSKCRLSIHGWFHGPLDAKLPSRVYGQPIPEFVQSSVDSTEFIELVNVNYINPILQSQVQYELQSNGEIMLTSFLAPDFYQQVVKDLKHTCLNWVLQTPYDKRCYEVALVESLPLSLIRLLTFFSSESMLITLTNLTGITLYTHSVGNDVAFKYKAEIRRLKAGSYSLLFDNKAEEMHYDTCALHLIMYMGCSGWKKEYGGCTSFINLDDGIEVLKLEPEGNSLCLVNHHFKSLPFINYVNHKVSGMNADGAFYQLHISIHFE